MSKDYVLDQIITLGAPVVQETWTAEHEMEQYLLGSEAYVNVTLRLEDGLEDAKHMRNRYRIFRRVLMG